MIGAIEGPTNRSGTIALDRGDVIALFTDGLTEAGPNRSNLLTLNGGAVLLSNALKAPELPVQRVNDAAAAISFLSDVTENLMSGVENFVGEKTDSMTISFCCWEQ